MKDYCLKIKSFRDCSQFSYYLITDKSSSLVNGSNSSLDLCHNTDNDNSLSSSISRSISCIKDIVKTNTFDYFVTLTLRDSSNLSQEQQVALFNKFIFNYKRLSKKYLKRF